MRVPLHIVIISCLLAAVIPWLLGTRNQDFMKEPSAEEIKLISKEWLENQHDITAPKDYDPDDPQGASNEGDDNNTHLVSNAQKNLTTAPSLSEYSSLGSKGSQSLISLAEHFETESLPLRALLAWERVLDSTESTEEERSKSVKSITRLKTELPPWNVDTTADIKLILHVGTSATDTAAIKKTLSKMALSLNQASSYIVRIDTKISKQVKGTKTAELTPLSLWFSSAEDQTIETPAVSTNADLKNSEALQSQLEQAIYQTLQVALLENKSLTPLPELKTGDQPLLHITRLMWREFANKLQISLVE